MFYPLNFCIGLRYLRSKQHNQFISFITSISILGIALSVTVLVTVMSIMNGFDEAIRGKIFDVAHHVTLQDLRRNATDIDWPTVRENTLKVDSIVGAAPFLASQGLLVHAKESQPVVLYGIIPKLESSVSSISERIAVGSFTLEPGKKEIVLGEKIAFNLGVEAGQTITLYLPILEKTLLGVAPRTEQFKIVGIFKTGKGLGLDNSLAYTHLQDLQSLLKAQSITGLRIKTTDLYAAPKIADALIDHIPSHYMVSDWTAQYGSLIAAIALEKTMTLWILLLLVAIAAFNLVSSLVMTVNEKKAEIAILRTLGMKTRNIVGIFMIQGSLTGLMGTLLGLGFGFILSQNISYLATTVERYFHLELFAGNVFIQTLPCRLQPIDFIRVGCISLIMSIIATIYPALRAAKTIPVEALRYE